MSQPNRMHRDIAEAIDALEPGEYKVTVVSDHNPWSNPEGAIIIWTETKRIVIEAAE